MFNPVDSTSNVELVYNEHNYGGFFQVNYGSNASMIDESLCEIVGIADYFPPLSDGSIVYRSFKTLKNYLDSPANVSLLMTPTYSFKDPFKQLIWDLGQVAIKCKTKGIQLDTKMDRIFVTNNDTPRVKAIAGVGVVGSDDKKLAVNLVGLYNEIKAACHKDYPKGDVKVDENFNGFLSKLGKSSLSLRATQNVFQSHYFFWNKYKKLRVINKLEDMVDCCKTVFAKVVREDLAELLTWRLKISSDPEIGLLFLKDPPRISSEDNVEVDTMLKYMRSNISHFRKLILGKTNFNNELEVVEYYDTAFPTIMSVIYKGCKAMTDSNAYRFDLI